MVEVALRLADSELPAANEASLALADAEAPTCNEMSPPVEFPEKTTEAMRKKYDKNIFHYDDKRYSQETATDGYQ